MQRKHSSVAGGASFYEDRDVDADQVDPTKTLRKLLPLPLRRFAAAYPQASLALLVLGTVAVFLIVTSGRAARPSEAEEYDKSAAVHALSDSAAAGFLARTRSDVARGVAEAVVAKAAASAGVRETPQPLPVRGVPPGELQKRYQQLRSENRFQCFDFSSPRGDLGQGFGIVNDDFCDCADGSDEPGTAACSGLPLGGGGGVSQQWGFACNWASSEAVIEKAQNHPLAKILRPGSVNDAICDCCGGEDEYDSGVHCPNRCDDALREELADLSRTRHGSEARAAFAARATALRRRQKYAEVDGGPDGVWLAAADEGCATLEADAEYSYTVCLFDKVKQTLLATGKHVSLGKHGKFASTLWEDGKSQRKDYSKLSMEDGDYCAAAGVGRRSDILFTCAAAQRLLSVQETQICVYTFHMETPAACPSL